MTDKTKYSNISVSKRTYADLQKLSKELLPGRTPLSISKTVDVLVGPMIPSGAPKIGQTEVDLGDEKQGIIPTFTQYSRAFNINGFPAMTVPCGFTDSNMPIGLQIAGRPWEEQTVLKVGHAFERATDWHIKRPPEFR